MGTQPHDTLHELAGRLRSILRRRRVLRAITFGSLARGEPSRRSDLDLIIVQQTDKRFLDRYEGLWPEIAAAVPERDIDSLIYTPEELARLSDRPFIAAALRQGRTIYESQQELAS